MARPQTRPSDQAAHVRPPTSKRVTFSLGDKGQDQVDFLSRVVSAYHPTSRAAVMRGLLQFATDLALESGDEVVRAVSKTANPYKSSFQPEVRPTDSEMAEFWARLLHRIISEGVDESPPSES